jgi:serine/threonine-protein kinase
MNLQSDNTTLEGQVLAGRYRVDEHVLGQGGMGIVMAGQHLLLDEPVAIKFLSAESLSDEAIARFEREARAAVKIKSEHVVRVLDVGRLDSGAPYMVMEYLDGEDLAKRLRRLGPLTIEDAVDFVLQACVAMADAHAAGIVHRDLKPNNLFCARRSDGRLIIKVLDFGISKQNNARPSFVEHSVTRTGAVLGCPLYMSPEQVQSSRHVDSRSDIWSLGVVLFELLTGVVPFAGEAFGEVAVKIATQAVTPLRVYREDVPAELEQVVARCLEKSPAHRFGTVAELARALSPFAPAYAQPMVERITRIVQASGTAASTLAAPPPRVIAQASSQGTVAEWSASNPVASNKLARAAAALLGVTIVSLAVFVGEKHGSREQYANAPSEVRVGASRAAPLATNIAVPNAPTSPSSTANCATSANANPVAAPSGVPIVQAPERSPTRTSKQEASRSPRALVAALVRPSKQPSAKAVCEPPYSIDDLGRKRFKPECVVNSRR